MMSTLIRALGPSRFAYAAPGLAFAAGLLAAGASQAQTVSVDIRGLSTPQVHAAIAKAAVRVCGEAEYNALTPTLENGCIEDTIATAVRQVPSVRLTGTRVAANRAPQAVTLASAR